MRLSALIAALPAGSVLARPDTDPVIRGVCIDSRQVAAGDLFVALRGSRTDAHAYLEQARGAGAAALVVEGEARVESPLPLLRVRDSRRALAPIACRFYGDPAGELELIGVTGTNGKTSVTYLVESMLARSGRRVGLIGTVEIRYPGECQRSLNTTPESLDLQRTLRAMRTQAVESVVMEVSSHGIELGRIAGCGFSVVAFTNLTQDHLDFHRDMDAYREAKRRLFREHLRPGGSAVVNLDDPAGARFADAAREVGGRVVGVSRRAESGAEVRLEGAEVRLDGSRARIRLPQQTIEVELPLIGDFNLENLLVACGIAVALGVEPEVIAAGAEACPQVPGRLERVREEDAEQPNVFVDYAHTPDAVDKVLRTLRPLTAGRLVCVFGCGGDRDRAKRPLMAQAVVRHSDLVLATSDNPRSEDPAAILADVEAGLQGLRRVEPAELPRSERAYALEPDRRHAIETAIALAGPRDCVLIAGKGHEDYQIIGGETLPFDDRKEARRALRRRRRA